MQDTKQTTREAEATALGHLVLAADVAEKLTVVLTAMREIVKGRTEPTSLIGTSMGEVIEHYAVEIVGAIREAQAALKGDQQGVASAAASTPETTWTARCRTCRVSPELLVSQDAEAVKAARRKHHEQFPGHDVRLISIPVD